jgi:hypothetical protein
LDLFFAHTEMRIEPRCWTFCQVLDFRRRGKASRKEKKTIDHVTLECGFFLSRALHSISIILASQTDLNYYSIFYRFNLLGNLEGNLEYQMVKNILLSIFFGIVDSKHCPGCLCYTYRYLKYASIGPKKEPQKEPEKDPQMLKHSIACLYRWLKCLQATSPPPKTCPYKSSKPPRPDFHLSLILCIWGR